MFPQDGRALSFCALSWTRTKMVSSNGGSTFGAAQSYGGIAVVTVLFCVSALSASAQSQNDPRSTARMRLGPFYVTPTILVKNLGIDTNVFNSVDDPKSDFTVTVGPNVAVFVPIWLAGVSVESVTDFVYSSELFKKVRQMYIEERN